MAPYEAQLNISCVDGMLEAIQGPDTKRIWDFLKERDHEGSGFVLNIRDTPESPLRTIWDNELVYKEIESWQ